MSFRIISADGGEINLSRCFSSSVSSKSSSKPGYNGKIDPSKTEVTRTKNPKAKVPLQDLVFGRSFTDHMLSIDWSEDKGWGNPKITPYGDLALSPACSALHYGIECFEGMKAYKNKEGKVLLFRPDCNMARLKSSMVRLAMPDIDGEAFTECIKQLLRIDESWIPDKEGFSMYIRPTAIGTSPFLGVHASEQVKLYVILSPAGPYFKDGFKPVKLYADTENVRAWPGGAGGTKVGGNYGPTIAPAQLASKKYGASQVLWLFGPNDEITEVGAMNIFFLLKKKGGETELVTAPLTRGDILPGVTRRSILELARGWKEKGEEMDVSERWLTMGEVVQAQKEGRLLEAFGAGTAAVISPVRAIEYRNQEIVIPTGDSIGPVAQRFWTSLSDIYYGKVKHPWSVPV